MDTMVAKLKSEREGKVTFIQGLVEQAMEASRDLSENELELITRSKDRIKAIDTQLETVAVDFSLDEKTAEFFAKHGAGVTGTPAAQGEVQYRSAGAYMVDYLSALGFGKPEDKPESEARLRRYYRAAAHMTTAQFAGVFPDAIVGPVINTINATRPLVSALGPTGVPNGPSFRRPRLNDPNFATGIDIQANQKDELVSQPFTLTSDVVNMSTLGGYVNVARQVVDWGVASMDVIVGELARRYSAATERGLMTEIVKSTGKVTLAAGADGGTITKAVFDGAAACYSATGALPNLLVAGPLGWARLGGAMDLAGRPVFPFLAPSNASGQQSATSFDGNPVGLRLLVTPSIVDDTFWVLNGLCAEVYEQLVGQLSVVEPSVLGIQVAYAGYVGYYRPVPNGAIHLAP